MKIFKNKWFWIILIVAVLAFIAYKKGLFGNLAKKGIMKHFDLSDFDTPATAEELGNVKTYHKGTKAYVSNSAKYNMDSRFLAMIDKARNEIQKGWNKLNPSDPIVFKINSGYRSPAYNDTLPNSVPNSAHTYGMASDISWAGYSEAQKLEMLKELYEAGFRRFGIGNSYVHVDNSDQSNGHPTPAVWTYGQSNPVVSSIEEIKSLTE